MKCLNCKKDFIPEKKRRGKKGYKYCCSKCYWEYKLKDILNGGDKVVK